MNNLNYDVFCEIFNFLSQKDCLNISILSKDIYNIIKNQGFLKILYVNKNYPRNKFEDAFEITKRIMMHKSRVETLYMNMINNPCEWIIFWPKNIYFNGCHFYKGVIDPKNKVMTEYIYIRCKYNCTNLKINYEKFPKLKKIIIE